MQGKHVFVKNMKKTHERERERERESDREKQTGKIEIKGREVAGGSKTNK